MRRYENRIDAQKKQYYEDRFFTPDFTPRQSVDESEFTQEIDALKAASVEILDSYAEFNQLVVYVQSEQNFKALKALFDFGYEQLSDMGAIDFIAIKGGYEVFYQLLSYSKNRRTRIKCFVKKEQMLQSVTQLYKSANWLEREMYDMSGVLIANHPNLKRLLMPDDWHSHPLLKSYPLKGDEHAAWYEIDRIFGRDMREEIGAENRDPAFIDSKDGSNFARIYEESELGSDYQEEGGVKFVKKARRGESKNLKERP